MSCDPIRHSTHTACYHWVARSRRDPIRHRLFTQMPSSATASAGSFSIRASYKAPPVEGRFVDESLFGETAAQRMTKAKSYTGPGASPPQPVPKAVARQGPRAAASSRAAAAVVVSGDDVARMRAEATLRDPKAERLAKAAAEEERARVHAVAEERKAKIRSLEAARLAKVPLSVLAQEAEDEKAARRLAAAAQLEDQTDDMKRMNSVQNMAITVAIRDRQVAEKRALAAAAAADERLRELSAEVDVFEALARADAAKLETKAKLAVVRDELAAQLEDALARKAAARAAVAAEEARRRASAEGEVAIERAEKAAREERRKRQTEDLIADNAAQIAARAARKAEEAARDAKADAEALAIARVKEEHLLAADAARLEKERVLHLAAANVSRVLDDRDEKDSRRQRREEELGARREKARAAAQAARAADAAHALRAAHLAMMAGKSVSAATMIEEERQEFARAAVVQGEWLEAARDAEHARALKSAALLRDLRAQMEEKKVEKAAARALEAAAEDQRQALVAGEMAMLARIRDKKVVELKGLGVDPRWANTVANLKFKA